MAWICVVCCKCTYIINRICVDKKMHQREKFTQGKVKKSHEKIFEYVSDPLKSPIS